MCALWTLVVVEKDKWWRLCVWILCVCVYVGEGEGSGEKDEKGDRRKRQKRSKERKRTLFETVDKQKSIWPEVGARVTITIGLYLLIRQEWWEKGSHLEKSFQTDRKVPEKKTRNETRIQLVLLFWAKFYKKGLIHGPCDNGFNDSGANFFRTRL